MANLTLPDQSQNDSETKLQLSNYEPYRSKRREKKNTIDTISRPDRRTTNLLKGADRKRVKSEKVTNEVNKRLEKTMIYK